MIISQLSRYSKNAMSIVQKELSRQIELEDQVSRLEKELSTAKSELHEQNTKGTPTAMSVAELNAMTLDNGFKVEIKPFVQGSIDKEDPDPAYEDITSRGEGSIIKWQVSLQFGKDETERASQAAQHLRELGYEPGIKLGVHHQTLQAYLRRHYQDKGFPLQTLYNGSAGLRAKIQRPKR